MIMNIGNKKIVTEVNLDPETGIKFVEDDRGNRYCVYEPSGKQEIKVEIISPDKDPKNLKKIIESLRRENVWLWEQIERARQNRKKKTCSYAMDQLDKAIKERQRL